MPKPTEDQVDEQLNRAYESKDEGGTRCRGMTYEDGVIAAIEWIRGNQDDAPMEDE